MGLNVSLHADRHHTEQSFRVYANVLNSKETGEFASITIGIDNQSIGLFGSVQQILDLCEQFHQAQQQIMRNQEAQCQEEKSST